MYLSELNIRNFRSFRDGVIFFDRNLTALVGGNNSGKSNIIEALRLITFPLNDRRDRYCEDNDVRDGAPNPRGFVLKANYDELSLAQKGLLLSAVPNIEEDRAIFGLTFKAPSQLKLRGEVKYWAGENGLEPERGSTDLIRHVYLPPLRDAQRVLASGNPTRILSLLRHFLGPDGDEAELSDALSRNSEHQTIDGINDTVGGLLNQLTVGVRPQVASLGFSENESLYEIARNLRFKLADEGIPPEDLVNSGLGFANLLFMATILVELDNAQEADLTLFLVEEPEAHLHPQLQASVLEFLLEKAKKSREKRIVAGKPEGHIQVIVTTHSPNMASGVKPSHISIVRSTKSEEENRAESVSISINKLDLPSEDEDKLERYIDVTKSSILFGQKCMLIEGITEALPLPLIARYYVFSGEDAENRSSIKKFLSMPLIPINGVDFKPYVKVLLSRLDGYCICDQVIVITDLDPTVPGNRKEDLEALALELNSSANLQVFENSDTLESELYTAENDGILKSIYLELHPRSQQNWINQIDNVDEALRPRAFIELLKNSNTRKGDFAQLLASRITEINNQEDEEQVGEENGEEILTFSPPQYLADAIRAVVA